MTTHKQQLLPGYEPTHSEFVDLMTHQERIDRALILLRENEPDDGYYLAFSGGKDSVVIKRLAEMAGVRFDAWYNNTTIDPPELVKFIKVHHADVRWNQPKNGSMMARVATCKKVPPTRAGRWCCEEYKEQGGNGRTIIIGVRGSESAGRLRRWSEVSLDANKNIATCPIVHWSDAHVWEFIRSEGVPYCSLYDEGWSRLGCVGCPLNPQSQAKEFERWPRYRDNWKRAIIKNWETYKDIPRNDGKPRYHAKFKTGEDMWQWWLTANAPDYFRGDCQSMMLWTNEDGLPADSLNP
jgi:phosphoadenosine phosphosulfate reductase